jgi:hypothetical protein
VSSYQHSDYPAICQASAILPYLRLPKPTNAPPSRSDSLPTACSSNLELQIAIQNP